MPRAGGAKRAPYLFRRECSLRSPGDSDANFGNNASLLLKNLGGADQFLSADQLRFAWGLFFVAVLAVHSALGGVATEFLIKGSDPQIGLIQKGIWYSIQV